MSDPDDDGTSRLFLPCSSGIEGDRLEARRPQRDDLVIQCMEGGDTASVWLTQTDARKLFCWLGVELHKSGWLEEKAP